MSTVVLGRMRALGRAELTLLLRNRTAVFTALLMPLGFVFLMRTSVSGETLDGTGLSPAGVAMTGGMGIVLVLVVYANLVSAYVARREELVLKRLRTGEPSDTEILGGTALPSVAIGLVQCALLVAAGVGVMDLGVPERVDLLLAGLLLGSVMLTALAAATSAVTRTAESAQLTVMPLMMVSFFASGLFIPLEVFPDALANVCRLLPVTPVTELVRYGWLGGADALDALRALGLALVWTVLAVFAVRRWFRWEPRR
ncbi:ABC transporter permease [Streptomyces sp. TRM 70351]|uniref:ABC transporter permease n=1 Tax=Streptomyces sp. TRM 70351 TaxID=3116552 RepID=UPI002E7B8D7A|nr:ABC transporter permease [Streptomyces sp. TRM 70351]MEE1929861.1 ABC transporter permease [Streptomyces sp. TRM 70351]